MISYSLNEEVIVHKEKVGNKAFNLARVANIIDNYAIANGFVVTAESIQDTDFKQGADYIFDECIRRKVGFPIILRSSANVEDSKYSFAGIFESHICRNRDELYTGLEKVMLAIVSQRLQLYCNKIGIERNSVTLSVIVQKVINADYAGVAFSKHPITNDNEVIYVEYYRENTSGVEEGNINPFRICIKKNGENDIGSLQKKMFNMLREYVVCLESAFLKPVDIEWAYTDQRLIILQIRPITT